MRQFFSSLICGKTKVEKIWQYRDREIFKHKEDKFILRDQNLIDHLKF